MRTCGTRLVSRKLPFSGQSRIRWYGTSRTDAQPVLRGGVATSQWYGVFPDVPDRLLVVFAFGADASASDVVRPRLASPRLAWRERVMGAWYAIRVGGPDATAAVVDALCTSLGSLDAPPLATAAVVLACPAAVDALEHYFAADQAHDWGASGVTAAAAQYLCEHHGVTTSLPPPTPADRDVFSALVDVARRLQTA
jgi:hypothetical protein